MKINWMSHRLSVCVTGIVMALPALAQDAKLDPKAADFFEKKIRPVLASRCYECHSSETKTKGNLALNTKSAMLGGGDSGPVFIVGKPEKSLLIKAIKKTDKDLSMPPKGPGLSEGEIADFEQWITMGAPDPRVTAVGKVISKILYDPEKVKTHWAFQPIAKPAVPQVKDSKKWVKNPIDAFILQKQTAQGIVPAAQADKRALIRRASYDLTGLPPSMGEVEAFLKDNASDAYAKLIDRLLKSSHYGERMGRHWLDVARYADTSGDRAGGNRPDSRYPNAWTYRDYVIKSFNEDKPFDRFILEQLAADRLDLGSEKDELAALGFITVGKRFMRNANDIIDDRIDVVTQGLMGLTVACARCHDHKFDPIPTKDYYSLHGVFASTYDSPAGTPLFVPAGTPEHDDYLKQVAAIAEEAANFMQLEKDKVLVKYRDDATKYMLAAQKHISSNKKRPAALAAREGEFDLTLFENWATTLSGWAAKHHSVMAPWVAFAALPQAEFVEAAKKLSVEIVANKNADKLVNPIVAKAFEGAELKSLKDVADIYAKLFKDAEGAWQKQIKNTVKTASAPAPKQKKAPKAKAKGKANVPDTSALANLPDGLPDADQEAIRQIIFGQSSPVELNERDMRRLLGNQFNNRYQLIQSKVMTLDTTHPGAPIRAMTVGDSDVPRNSTVLIRGEAANRGPVVPRQFIQIASGADRQPFKNGSGRLEMAQAIASRDNPLTARVIVNRVWQWHFGEGIVRASSDFGLRTDAPTHAQLLDWLATWFVDNGWSIKKLHHLIMTSNTYQQKSAENPAYRTMDPSNTLVWRWNMQRLDFESFRDSLLAVSGKLNHTIGGRPTDLGIDTKRRTVYGLVDRLTLTEMFRTFDFANPDMSSGQRIETTVPQQALFLMNSPFVIHQVRAMVDRSEVRTADSNEDKVRALYELALQRAPSSGELKLAMAYVDKQPDVTAPKRVETPAARPAGKTKGNPQANRYGTGGAQLPPDNSPLNRWERLAQVLLESNEFVHVN